MAIGIDDLYDDDDDVIESQNQDVDQAQSTNPPVQQEETNVLEDFLKSRGIDDPSKIKFEDDNGNIEERDWNSLSKEEQFNILNTPLEEPKQEHTEENDLSDDEINLINQIRQSNLTPEEYLKQLSGQPVEPQYKIDDLSDDEIYLLDLEDRVGELSDEDAAQALANAKQNEQLFQKQVEGIRKEYKEREENQAKTEEAQRLQEEQEVYEQFKDSVIEAVKGFNNIGNFDLNFDDNDRNELAQFMLEQDESGNNYLWQALQEPETLVKAAWFILNGDEAFESISDYFSTQIKQVAQDQYNKGLEDGKKGIVPKPKVIIDTNKKSHRSYNSIDELDDDD